MTNKLTTDHLQRRAIVYVRQSSPAYYLLGLPESSRYPPRTIQEITAGFRRVFWINPNLGKFQLSGQYSWLVRRPRYVAPGQPASANWNMMYLGLRYILSGSANSK